jgi:hypothetical protein
LDGKEGVFSGEIDSNSSRQSGEEVTGNQGILFELFCGSYSNIYDIDWIWEALPESYLRLGPAITSRLKEHIEGQRSERYEVITNEVEGLWNIWLAHPSEKQGIEDFFLTLLQDRRNTSELNANLIADFAQLGRTDLKPLFLEFFEKGEVDLDVLTREDMEHFFDNVSPPPGYRKDLEGFYSPEEVENRQKRWKEEDERVEQRAF